MDLPSFAPPTRSHPGSDARLVNAALDVISALTQQRQHFLEQVAPSRHLAEVVQAVVCAGDVALHRMAADQLEPKWHKDLARATKHAKGVLKSASGSAWSSLSGLCDESVRAHVFVWSS